MTELEIQTQDSDGGDTGAVGTRDFCTYLDTNYVGRALALHESLRRHSPGARLRAICFDDLSHRALSALAPPGLEAIHSSELEQADPEFRATRESRSPVEYLWTATPCVLEWLIERDGLDELTYLDADMYFFSSPEPFFDELGDGSVLLTPASSAPQHYSRRLAERAGLYVVQFMTFRSDRRGREALGWWREQCLEQCSMHYKDGKMGDQKYLDDWIARFPGSRNLGHPGMLGPWNIETRQITRGPDGIEVDGVPLVLYHFMGLRLYEDGRVRNAAGRFRITPEQRRWIYEPYVRRVRELRAEIARIEPEYAASLQASEPLRWRLQAPVSALIGAIARARVRAFPHLGIGPYLEGGYVPDGYDPEPPPAPPAAAGRPAPTEAPSDGRPAR